MPWHLQPGPVSRVPGGEGPNAAFSRLKRQLRENERIWGIFRDLELKIIAARSLREVAALVSSELPRAFLNVSCSSLVCLDPRFELARLVEHGSLSPPALGTAEPSDQPVCPPGALVTCSTQDLAEWFAEPYRPYLGRADRLMQRRCFPHYGGKIGSVALAPLVFQGRLIGCLAQASADAAHFTARTATDLLEHLAAVIALSIDSQVNRERLKLDGLTDALTGVANRRYCERRLQGEIERWRRRHEPLVCMLVDVDFFKRINDEHGHQAGDAVLKEIATLLAQELRAADVLARYGGEEFILMLPSATRTQGVGIAERVRERVAGHCFAALAGSRDVTVSIGVANLDAGTTDVPDALAEWLIQMADAALYQAKEQGRNRVVIA